MAEKKQSYQGLDVFVGIDVHLRTWTVVCVCEGAVVYKTSLPARKRLLLEMLAREFPGARIVTAYEAGFCGFGLHRYLEGNGIESLVINPSSIEIAARDRVKTDRRDGLKLATQLAAGRLKAIHVPSPEQEQRRLVTRLRETLVTERTRTGHRIRSKLLQFGLLDPDDRRRMGPPFIRAIKEMEMPEMLRFAVDILIHFWEELDGQVKRCGEQLRRQVAEEAELTRIYCSVPGIGPVIGRTLANELGDMTQFPNERALFSFTGLTPTEYSSGEKRLQGHISRQGNPRLRRALVEATWLAVKKDPDLERSFNRIAARAGKKRAVVAIARKLVGRIRACIKAGRSYRLGYETAA